MTTKEIQNKQALYERFLDVFWSGSLVHTKYLVIVFGSRHRADVLPAFSSHLHISARVYTAYYL